MTEEATLIVKIKNPLSDTEQQEWRDFIKNFINSKFDTKTFVKAVIHFQNQPEETIYGENKR